MPYTLVRNDITQMRTDAIVNAANASLLGGGGVDGAIHRAAGPGLLEECRKLHGCVTGDAKITRGYNLYAKYVIHTVGPVWEGGNHYEKDLLYSCYWNSLMLARKKHLKSIAFPLISTGAFGYPTQEALQVATDAITRFLETNEMDVYLVLYSVKVKLLDESLFDRLEEYLDDNYEDSDSSLDACCNRILFQSEFHPDEEDEDEEYEPVADEDEEEEPHRLYQTPYTGPPYIEKLSDKLEETEKQARGKLYYQSEVEDVVKKKGDRFVFNLDESFSEMLLRLIKEKEMTETECYKNANIDRKLFSKIRSRKDYRPSKATVCAFIISLKLNMQEAKAMLASAGFAFSHSSKFDVMIEFFIHEGIYNIYDINEALCDYDQPLLGSL